MSRRRLILGIAACLAAGALINMLVAWACWLTPAWRLDQEAPLPTRTWPAWCRAEWAGAPWPEPMTTRTSWNTYRTLTRTRPAERVPRQFASPAPATVYAQWGSGLPLRSMGVSYAIDHRSPAGADVRSRGELALSGWVAQRCGSNSLPGRPLPLGFAANTLLYALLVAAPFSGLRGLRRRLRRRRGLCERCAYPAGTLGVCSECGATLPRPT